MNDTNRLQRIHDFTANYFFWQGLRWVPLGFALLILSLQPARLLALGKADELVIVTVVMIVAMVVSNAIGRWYGRTFGIVRSAPGLHVRRDLLKWTVFYPLIAVALLLDCVWRPPILLSGPAWAAALVGYWASTGRGRNHYLVFAGAFAVATFVPLVNGPGSAMQRLNFILAMMGVVYIVAGVLDHFALVRMLRRTEANDGGTAV